MENENLTYANEAEEQGYTTSADSLRDKQHPQHFYPNPSVPMQNDPETSQPPRNQQTQPPQVQPQESASAVEDPQNLEEVYLGSFLSVLRDNLGYYVVIEFLIGTGNLVEKEGILYAAGNNFVTLYEQETDRYIVCDLFSIKFVTFYNQTSRPRSRMPGYNNRNGNSTQVSSRRIY